MSRAEPCFFLDRDIASAELEQLLRARGIRIENFRDHFAQDTPDHIWVPEVAAQGWIAITGDKRIRGKAHRREGLCRELIITHHGKLWTMSGRWPPRETAAAILLARHRLVHHSGGRGFVIGTVYKDGAVRVIESWRKHRREHRGR